MQQWGALSAKLVAITVGVPLVVLAAYAWLFPLLNLKTPYGIAIGVLISATLGFFLSGKPTAWGQPSLALSFLLG
jgi:hypothetical protein